MIRNATFSKLHPYHTLLQGAKVHLSALHPLRARTCAPACFTSPASSFHGFAAAEHLGAIQEQFKSMVFQEFQPICHCPT